LDLDCPSKINSAKVGGAYFGTLVGYHPLHAQQIRSRRRRSFFLLLFLSVNSVTILKRSCRAWRRSTGNLPREGHAKTDHATPTTNGKRVNRALPCEGYYEETRAVRPARTAVVLPREGGLSMLFAGIDWSRQHLDYHLADAAGAKLAAGQVRNDCRGVAELCATLREKAGPEPVAIAFESSSAPWVQALLDAGFELYPVNAKMAARFREAASAAGDKCDRLDAALLQRLLDSFHDRLRPLRPDAPEIIALRIACTDRVKLVQERVAVLQELSDTLREVYPVMLGFFGDLDSRISLEFLQDIPTQDQFRALSSRKLQSWLRRHDYHCAQRLPRMLQALTEPVLGVPSHRQQAKAPQICYLAESLLRLDAEIVRRNRLITEQFEALPEAGWVSSLPGAGPTLAPAVVACFGRDRQRFETPGAAQAYMGTAPVTKASGSSRVVVFRRSCCKFARRTLYLLATQSLLAGCKWVRRVYDQQRARGKRHATALRVVAHKWVRIILAMQRDGTPYDELRLTTP
jgi:transposase